VQRLAGVMERGFESEGEEDDPAEHWQVR
jgi:hypothetical protein